MSEVEQNRGNVSRYVQVYRLHLIAGYTLSLICLGIIVYALLVWTNVISTEDFPNGNDPFSLIMGAFGATGDLSSVLFLVLLIEITVFAALIIFLACGLPSIIGGHLLQNGIHTGRYWLLASAAFWFALFPIGTIISIVTFKRLRTL